MQSNITSCEIKPGFHSDHSMLQMHIASSQLTERAKGLWKFNTSQLKDNEFVKSMNEKLNKVISNGSY